MKKIFKITISSILLIMTTLFIVGCKEKIKFEIKCPQTLYVTETAFLEGVTNKEDVLMVKNLTPEFIEINGNHITGLKAGIAEVEFSDDSGKIETYTINVLEQPLPSSASILIHGEEIKLGVEYAFEIVTEPKYAKKDFELSYDMNVIEINEEKQTIKFLRSGNYTVTCYSNDNFSVRSTVDANVVLNSEIESYELLYIGNSLTKFNLYNVPLMVQDLLKQDNVYAYITIDTISNQWLYTHAESFNELIKEREYSHVILQEYSNGTLTSYDKFSETVSQFNELIKENNAKTVLYETWGYTTGYKGTTDDGVAINTTKDEMRAIIFEKYHQKAEEIDAMLFCSGEAFAKCEELYPEITLYSDSNHGSLEGGFLSACVHYATLTGRRVSNNSYRPADISEEVANKLKEVADIIVFGIN